MAARTALADSLHEALRQGLLSEASYRRICLWLEDSQYAEAWPELERHIQEGRFRELDDLFWTVIPFGTGGRRGRMYPIGTNAINDRTIAESAQGLADYLRQCYGQGATLTAVVAHDTRHHSDEFARVTARVLASNGIRTFLFPDFRATPELSFAIRYLGAVAGVVISASHNPPTDNGFKCYWRTGAQVVPPHDEGILRCVEQVRTVRAMPFQEAIERGWVHYLSEDVDEAYTSAVCQESLGEERHVRIVYTPLHGVGRTSVERVLRRAGFTDLWLVESQAAPDGNFPNVVHHLPNPELPEAWREALELASRVNADLALASDPDADRVGAAVFTGDRWAPLTGNQIAVLLAEYILSTVATRNQLQEGYLVKTYVTTEMLQAIADRYSTLLVGDLPVGFKWIAQEMETRSGRFLFGAEESLGYLKGTYTRDKDGAVGALLLSELAAKLKREGSNLWQELCRLYLTYGYYHEETTSIPLPGREGAEAIAQLMAALRRHPPGQLGSYGVTRLWDFGRHEVWELRERKLIRTVERPEAEMITLELERPGWRVVARPSGTEPKAKFYLYGFEPPERLGSLAALREAQEHCRREIEAIVADLRRYIQKALTDRS
jgi:phosphoglucomutase